jgi:hypothetical protein
MIGLGVAVFGSICFYFFMASGVQTQLDVYFYYFGVGLPFGIPFYLMFKDWRERFAKSTR